MNYELNTPWMNDQHQRETKRLPLLSCLSDRNVGHLQKSKLYLKIRIQNSYVYIYNVLDKIITTRQAKTKSYKYSINLCCSPSSTSYMNNITTRSIATWLHINQSQLPIR